MRKLVLFVLVLVALFVMVGCAKEPTPTPIETNLEVDEIIEVLDGQEYLLALIINRKEVSGGYEYIVKLTGQQTYDREKWYFSEDYLLTGYLYPFVKIDETHYYLTGTINE